MQNRQAKTNATQMDLFSGDLFSSITPTDITRIDTAKARAELGELRDDNDVSLWDVIEGLRRDGVTKVHFV